MVELERLVGDVETEGGIIRGIDLGSIYSGPRGNDASDFKIGLESIALAAGWRERCHAMTSGGDWARRYYIAEPPIEDRDADAGQGPRLCTSCRDRLSGTFCDLCGDCHAAEASLGRDCGNCAPA
jgi:hypothetical protein